MGKSLWEDVVNRVTTNPVDLIAFVMSALTIAVIPVQPFLANDLGSAAGLSAIVAGGIWFLFRSFRLLRPAPIETSHFTGIRPLSPEQVWPRDEAYDEIVRRIHAGTDGMVFVSGRSGAGKTTLLNSRIIPGFTESGWCVARVEQYEDVAKSVWLALGGDKCVALDKVRAGSIHPGSWLPEDRAILFVFDQIERLVGTADENVNWLRLFCAAVKDVRHLRVVAVVRQEFYYQLRVLRELVPAPGDVYEVPDLDFSKPDEDVRAVRRLLQGIVDDAVAINVVSDVTTSIASSSEDRELANRVSPLEMQVAGEALEREYLRNHGVSIDLPRYRKLGGTRQSLLRAYFDYYIARSPNRELAPAVLFALSVVPPPHGLTTAQICRATYALPNAVDGMLQYFEKVELLRSVKGRYQWVHESLATMFLDATPTDMLPALREAIQFHVQHPGTGFSFDRVTVRRLLAISAVVFGIMVTTIAAWTAWTLLRDPHISSTSYAIAAPAHTAWAFFVFRFARTFVVRLRTLAWVAWGALAVSGAISIGVAIVLPEAWIAAMGLTGFAIGLILLAVTGRRLGRPLARAYVGNTGASFVIIGVVMVVAGVAYAALTRFAQFEFYLARAGGVLSIAFVALAASSTQRYATAGTGTAWLSYIERP